MSKVPLNCFQAPMPELNWTFADSSERRKELRNLEHSTWIARGICGYVLFRHADCSAVLRDDRWHNAFSLATEMMGSQKSEAARRSDSLITAEGEAHSRIRRLVSSSFSPKSADVLRPFMDEILNSAIDRFMLSGQAELMHEMFNLFPIQVVAEMIGAPKTDWEPFGKWAEDILSVFKEDALENLGTVFEAHKHLRAYVKDLIARRRVNPGDDLVTSLIAAKDQDNQLDEEEMIMMVESIIVGGTDTVRNQMGIAIALLLEHPEQWREIVKDPDLIEPATEEALRFQPITGTIARFASEDIVYRGLLFPRGTLVSFALAEANRDPQVYENPHTFDIRRERNRPNLTFGAGSHYCLAPTLARAEIQEVIRVLTTRLPNLRIDGHIVWRDQLKGVLGPVRLPVAF